MIKSMDFRNSSKEPWDVFKAPAGARRRAQSSQEVFSVRLIPSVWQKIIKKGWTRQFIKIILDRVTSR